MPPRDYLIQMLLEFLYEEYNRYQNDVEVVKERIRLFGIDSDRVHELLVCETRRDTMAIECRKIRQIIKAYSEKY